MPLFTKLPVTITADQWFKNGDHPDDYAQCRHGTEGRANITYSPQHQKVNGWEGQVVRRFRLGILHAADECKHCAVAMAVHGWIDTLEGGHVVCPGDWVITGVAGERYPCKPAIFETAYRPHQENEDGST